MVREHVFIGLDNEIIVDDRPTTLRAEIQSRNAHTMMLYKRTAADGDVAPKHYAVIHKQAGRAETFEISPAGCAYLRG